MSNRATLAARARVLGLDPSTITNDSVLEQRIEYLERNANAVTGALAVGTLTSTGTAPANNDTVTIGDITYTFKTALTGAAYEVLIGASAAVALDNLKIAINNTGGTQGTEYGLGTVEHPQVTATTNTATTQVVEARFKNLGNSIVTTEASSQLSWGGATLASGLPGVVAAVDAQRSALNAGQPV